jgi:phenylacetate-coenzyme A ligase PaaK-like adenylate-forming protein
MFLRWDDADTDMNDMYATFVRHALAPLDAFRQGSDHYSILKELRESQYASADKLQEMALVKLNETVRYAFEHCPFYQGRFVAAGYNPSDELDEKSFRQLPTLSKRDIQENLAELRSDEYSDDDLIANQTGGSTGEPLKFYLDKQRAISRLAATLRHDEWAGYRPGDKVGLLWGAAQDFADDTSLKVRLRKKLLDRTLTLNAVSMSTGVMTDYYQKLCEFQPKVLLAYAHTAYVFAEFLRNQGLEVPSPDSIITSAELLSAEERKVIEAVFNTEVFDRYGCREVSIIASECESHDGLHVNVENIYLEILKGARPANDCEIGEIVLTDLENRGMPLIRYRIADSAKWVDSSKACSCGRTLPRIRMTGGRVNEFLVTADGRLVAGTALTIFLSTEISGVAQMQLYQKEAGELTVRVVADDSGIDEAALLEKSRSFLGEDMRISVSYQEYIPREKSGKYRFSISEVAGDFIGK